MNQYFESIRRFKSNSIFFRFYLILLGIVLFFTVIFAIYNYQQVYSSYGALQDSALSSFAEQSERQMDGVIYMVSDTVSSLARNSQLVKSVIVPRADNVQEDFATASVLRETAENYNYIDQIYFTEFTMGKLFESAGWAGQLSDSPDFPLIEYCDNEKNWSVLEETTRSLSGLTVYEHELYFCRKYIEAAIHNEDGSKRYIAMLVIRLNLEELFGQLISVVEASPYQLTVTAGTGEMAAVLARTVQDPVEDPIVVTRTSDYTGWTYSLYAPAIMKLSLSDYLIRILPFFGVLLFGGLLAAFLAAALFYRPILLLLSSIRPEDEEAAGNVPSHSGEVELMQHRYEQLRSDRQEARGMLKSALPDLEARLLLDAIAGEAPDDGSMLEQLRKMGSTLEMHGKYQCLLVGSDGKDNNPMAIHLLLKQAQDALSVLTGKKDCIIYFIRTDSTHLCCVIHYDNDLSAARIQKLQASLQLQTESVLRQVSEHLTSACGTVYLDLENISLSYHEAMEQLRKKVYYSDEDDTDPEGNGASETVENENDGVSEQMKDPYLDSQLSQLSALLKKNDSAMARQQLSVLIKEICVTGKGMAASRYYGRLIIEMLSERIVDFLGDAELTGKPNIADLFRELEAITDAKQLQRFLTEKTDWYMDAMHQYLGIRQNRLILQAKEYIRQHYSNSDLSISDIADSIGISSTYLSTIFTEYTGENLIHYLNACRVGIAREMLAQTQILIKEVGFRTGFNTVQNFNRTFKKHIGMTPGEYRSSILKDNL